MFNRNDKRAMETGRTAPPESCAWVQEQFQLDASHPIGSANLIDFILKNPVAFISDPSCALSHFTDIDFNEAHAFFSASMPDRYVFSVCSTLLRARCSNLDLTLYASDMAESRESRFWPFWHATEFRHKLEVSIEEVQDYLLNLWNNQEKEPWLPRMYHQNGFLQIIDSREIGKLYFIKCLLPIRHSVGQTPDTLTFAFDQQTGSLFTANARVKFTEAEHRFRYVEFIPPSASAPDVRNFLSHSKDRSKRILFVLDRHIGDNLSLFSTHLLYLANLRDVQITIDASACPLFQKAPLDILQRFLPRTSLCSLDSQPADMADFDLVFDPYDWLSDMFDLKPQNDSGVCSIVSGLEYGQCLLHERRRDILDIHMSALKRMGIAPANAPTPEFVQYRISESERATARKKKRLLLLGDSADSKLVKIVTIFPYGLAEDRRYPVESLRTVITSLLQNPHIHIVIAGVDYDSPEMTLTLRGNWWGKSKSRIKMFSNEPIADLIEIMLASDVLVSMDSGPLHLARALRKNPIALYTSKVNVDAKALVAFPWLVEDGTASILKPDPGNPHVSPATLVEAVKIRLS